MNGFNALEKGLTEACANLLVASQEGRALNDVVLDHAQLAREPSAVSATVSKDGDDLMAGDVNWGASPFQFGGLSIAQGGGPILDVVLLKAGGPCLREGRQPVYGEQVAIGVVRRLGQRVVWQPLTVGDEESARGS